MNVNENFIIDSLNNKIAVQLDIDVYDKIMDTLENFALFKFIEENKDDEVFSLTEAKRYYKDLKNNGN